MNDFLLNEAAPYRKYLLAVTYVFENVETKEIVGYFSLANDKISLTDFLNKTEFNRFRKQRFVNKKRIKSYPAVKICRLGVSETFHGKGVGTRLLYYDLNVIA